MKNILTTVKNVLPLILIAASFSSSFAQKAEKGWTKLFDGKSLEGWKQMAGDANYKVEKGQILGTSTAVLNSGNSFLVYEKEYADFVLELDVKVESTLSNSGVQVRSHYDPAANKGKGRVFGRQIEIDPSTRKWSGGIYDEGRRDWLYPMTLNSTAQDAFKVGEFNHLKIECIGNEMKTWVNGIPCGYVVDTLDQSGFIALQMHGITNAEGANKKVYFKDIRIKTSNLQPTPFPKGVYVVNKTPNALSDYEKQDGWRLLFDGETSKGWKGAYKKTFPEKGWTAKNGLLTVLAAEGKESTNGGDIVSEEQFKSFDLSFEFKITPGANSGVKYFVTLSENNPGSAIGLEYQVLDDERHPDAKLGRDGNRTLGSLYDLMAAKKENRFIRAPGQWNTGRVVVYPDNSVEHYLNGIKVLSYVRGSKEYRDLVALSKYTPFKNFGEATSGHILIQDHGNLVSYRSIKIKAL